MSLLHLAPDLLAQTARDPRYGWLPVALLLVIAVGFAATNILISIWIGPKRTGPGKETTYESGMMPIGNTRSRFNVFGIHWNDASGTRNGHFAPFAWSG